ncbi:MAG: phospholipase D-like domain-containing protein, partial [Endomicrobia bacterium]|nr:phospholipase D-like domain-containing protein [Endomicrobiia bacterium]
RLMHNKFVVVKSSKVWTGSYNFTISATYEQDNFAIEIFSKDLAEIYEKAFWYMWNNTGNINDFNGKSVTLSDGTKVSVYFNPYSQNPELKDVLIENWYDKIEGKVKVRSLYFAVAWFTEQALKEILLKLVDNNVAVSGIVDDNASGNSVFTELRTKGVDIWYDSRHTLTSGDGLMHHKFCVVDPYGASPKVICGSANWSEQGLSSSTVGWNYENILVIESREVAEVFYKEFLRLYKKAVAEKVISTSDELVEAIIFYPNPVSKKLNIKFTPNRGVKEVKFLLISLYGIRMYEENLNFIAGVENKVEISIPNEIKEGLYYGILRVKSFEFSKDYVKKIIVR